MSSVGYLIVNFGGPRSLSEVHSFLCALLTDRDVISTSFPLCIHNFIFRHIAKKRAVQITHDYKTLGGKSPIYEDTEAITQLLREKIGRVFTFHRYLPDTHTLSLNNLEQFDGNTLIVFPMFPQFSYSTTGSIARFFKQNLTRQTLNKLFWVKSYASHSAFIHLVQNNLRRFLEAHSIHEKDVCLLFSAHGLPMKFIGEGDPYAFECRASFLAVMNHFPQAKGILCFQSKFGKGNWLDPSTQEICETIETRCPGRNKIVIIPIAFTSDHIETLFEIEQQYLPILKKKNLMAYRLSAFNRDPTWIDAIVTMIKECSCFSTTDMLIKPKAKKSYARSME